MNKIITATKNKGKIAEIKQILKDLPAEVVSMVEEGINLEIVENGQTFEENALIKARAIKEHTNGIALADDSGLVVDALDGAPGVYSSRFAGEPSNDDKNNEKLLSMMNGIEQTKRTARFICVIAVIMNDGREFCVRGECEGRIGYEPKGSNGFGYDPLFFMPEYGKTMAELEPGIKNQISHRAKALEKFKIELKKLLV
ncbi:MAG: XTP/dITP diphosphatase [Ignavibacteriales bacterium]